MLLLLFAEDLLDPGPVVLAAGGSVLKKIIAQASIAKASKRSEERSERIRSRPPPQVVAPPQTSSLAGSRLQG